MKHFKTFDGLNIAYQDEGEGLPVLCLSGLTRNSSDFDYVAPHLKGVRLIRTDYRGRGASDWDENYKNYTIPVEARDVICLLDHLGIDRAAMLATSRGGLIAMALAATAKDRMNGVCLNDIGPVIDPSGLDRIMDYVGHRPRFATQEDMARAMAKNLPGFANVPMSRWREEVQKQTIQTGGGLQLTYDPKLRDALLDAGAQAAPDLWPFFDAMGGLPLAVIRGANSDLLTKDTVAEMQRRRPDMIFAEVPDRAHIPFLDEPRALDAINRWLEACK